MNISSALTPELILEAYRVGLFPMAPARQSRIIDWYDPEMRGVFLLRAFHVPRRLAHTILQKPYRITCNQDFRGTMVRCANARPETWINDALIEVYTDLHHAGFAHSIEAWDEAGKPAGGIYGLCLGAAFFGESMYSFQTDASKIALTHLAAHLWGRGFMFLDAQFPNDHLRQFGLQEVPRDEYHRWLQEALAQNILFQSSKSVSGAGADGAAGATGLASGVDSDENSWGFADVALFLQSMTQTS